MKESKYLLDSEKEESIFLMENLMKYVNKWPWFLLSLALCLLLAFLYIRYAPVVYSTEARIKIIDDSKEFDIAEDALSLLGGGSNINLDNEIAVLKSYRILDQVVNSLNMDVKYYEVGNVKTQQVHATPIIIRKLNKADSVKKPVTYQVVVTKSGYEVTDDEGNTTTIKNDTTYIKSAENPIKIFPNPYIDTRDHIGKSYLVELNDRKSTVLQLMDEIDVKPLTEKSDVLSIQTKSESPLLSETILNELVSKFNTDGILDRQLVSKRTLDFIDERFRYLSEELDSIEIGKERYKQENNLSYIEADAGMTIERKSIAETEVFRLKTQIELSKLLKRTLNNQNEFSLLPADIGVENVSINSLVFEYNQAVLKRKRLIVSAGENNPAVLLLSSQLKTAKQNINNTVNSYRKQLQVSLQQLEKKEESAEELFYKLPEKEKILRSIERQQLIKENLFLLLLQKREEAAINFAITAPSVKVVDYGLTNSSPVAPKKGLILGISFFLGLFIPLAFFFTKESFDTKVKAKSDIERISGQIPIVGEIPSLENPTSFSTVDDRSVKAESFRILGTNIKYLLPLKENGTGHTIYITSAIKGEGKTLTSINLAIAFSSLKKKVLLIGADLRNPQLHTYFGVDRNVEGLSNILHNPSIDIKSCIQKKALDNEYLDVCYSGPIPPNASQLIASEYFKTFLEYASSTYDYVVIDTAPTVLVADTLLMAEYADVTIFITRSNFTDKRLIEFSKGLSNSKKLKNVAYVLNDVDFSKNNGYNYGYEYGYGNEVD